MTEPNDCPIPANERERIAALRAHEILDSPPEVEFDALTRVAAHAFDTPIAVVAMLDSERLWFKSRLGMTIPQLERKIAFCAHAIMKPDEPLIVPDLAADLRFADNPLVARPPHIRFYAGAPLVDEAGFALGTIAVLDARPREFSAAQRDALVDLSTLVVTALEGRKRAIDLSRLALTDRLTGIANRVQFEVAIEAEVANARRYGETFALIWMDLDDFKRINDTFGHEAGDEVLAQVAGRLSELVRKGDTLARYGGDEFAIVMRHADAAAALGLIGRIVQSLAPPFALSSGSQARVGVSCGLALYSPEITSGAELTRRADQALYQAKGRPISRSGAG
jgi:diguanylate cyclase (GGDEF)-like protein